MKKEIFSPTNILLPKQNFEAWSVIACDQFTSNEEYWQSVKRAAGEYPTTLNLIYPEVYLGKTDAAKMTESINNAMQKYVSEGVFQEYPNALIYVERTQRDGLVRCGIVGAVDLDAYDYQEGSASRVRATEKTVLERIPPRVEIRKNATLELPHILMLMDDAARAIVEPLSALAAGGAMQKLYDFDLMLDGGHLRGYLIPEEMHEDICQKIEALGDLHGGITLAVGDGNHSLATAKACRALGETECNRYALCEVMNIHSEALVFEPIFRTVEGVSAEELLAAFKEYLAIPSNQNAGNAPQEITFVSGTIREVVIAKQPPHALAVGTVQQFLDVSLADKSGVMIDYIHDEDELL
ncbi:MAG: DUF1015 domain-containing protein, partial [Clostridia bacterium]|nr:DUF1015 domain-containing protein [Clostridia bacterium]